MKRGFAHILIGLMAFLCLATPTELHAQVRGVTGLGGVIYPKEKDRDIELKKGLIQFNGFEPYSSFNTVYELKNESFNVKDFTTVLPFYLFFTDFDKENRSSILNNLEKVFPSHFSFEDVNADLEQDLRKPFKERKYINQFISPSKLALLHITKAIMIDNRYVDIRKVEVNMMWVNEGNNQSGLGKEAFLLKVNVHFDLQFEPEESKTIKTYCQVPSYYCGKKEKLHYAPFVLGTAKNWKGNIGQLYLVNNNFTSQLAIPTGINSRQLNLGKHDNLTVISNYKPDFWEKVAFYHSADKRCSCDNRKVNSITFPYGVSEMTSSSRTVSSGRIPNLCIEHKENISVVDKIDDFNTAGSDNLSLFEQNKKRLPGSNYYERLVKARCNTRSSVSLSNNHEAVYAFDQSLDAEKDGKPFFKKTSWCEFGEGTGEGQYIEFTLNQPVKEILLFNGNQETESSFTDYGRIRSFLIERTDGSFVKSLPATNSELLNVFTLTLEPGRYRLTITNTYPGEVYDDTCISSLQFNYTYSDKWLDKAMEDLNTVR